MKAASLPEYLYYLLKREGNAWQRFELLDRYSMNKYIHLRTVVLLGISLGLAGAVFAQSVTDKKLLINGKAAGAVLQVNGHSYVDIETLAKLTNGSISFEANQIVLTIPPSHPSLPASSGVTSPQSTEELSKGFASAAIGALAEMREWKGAVGTMVTFGLAVSGAWAQTYYDRAEASLAQASVAASTNADRNALRLLNNQYNTLSKWAGDVAAARQALNGAMTTDPNAMQNDPVLIKFSKCDAFLSSMLISRVFADNSSCD
ncbi:MAG: hypothetical protein WBE86_04035 [Candidatus Acidiferrales bacterium]